jgi:hypothetical protein
MIVLLLIQRGIMFNFIVKLVLCFLIYYFLIDDFTNYKIFDIPVFTILKACCGGYLVHQVISCDP